MSDEKEKFFLLPKKNVSKKNSKKNAERIENTKQVTTVITTYVLTNQSVTSVSYYVQMMDFDLLGLLPNHYNFLGIPVEIIKSQIYIIKNTLR